MAVIKLDAFGAYQWHTFYGGPGCDVGRAIVNDGEDIYIAGDSTSTWDGPDSVAPLHAFSGSLDFLIVKLNSAGAYQWHTFYGSYNDDYGNAIAIDSSKNIYVAGTSWAIWNGPDSATLTCLCRYQRHRST